MLRWLKLIVVLVVLLALVWIALNLGNALLGLISGADLGGDRDPMFAQETMSATSPPEIYPEETQKPHKTLDDYVPEEETPVDKTARELIPEAQSEG